MIALPAVGSIFASYNAILERAAALEDLEALVLVHQDAEIVDAGFCRELRAALDHPDVAVVGCVGAIGVRNIAWWEGSVTWASFTHRGGGPGEEFPSFSWDLDDLPPYARMGEVDTVDGFVMALSPWAVQNVRFDESLGQLHGYDLDYCLQVRSAGKRIRTANLRVIHHHSLELANDPEGWVEAHVKVAEKWDGRIPGADAGPRRLEVPRTPRRGRARRRPGAGHLDPASDRCPHARERAGAQRGDRQHRLADHRPVPGAGRASQAPALVVAQSAAQLIFGERRPASAT